MILIISHGNGKSGAPISLLNFCKILKNNGYELLFICKDEDVLTPEFKKLGKLLIWQRPWNYESNIIKRIRNRLLESNRLRQKNIFKLLSNKKIEFVLNNTITNGDVLNFLSPLNLTTITWVHEMESVIQIYDAQPNGLIKNTFKYTDFYWTASDAVKNNLITNHKINPEKIDVIFEIIDVIDDNDDFPESSLQFTSTKNVGDFIIGGCGQNGWRKGTDLFLQVAIYIKKKYPYLNIKFLWVGGQPKLGQYIEFKRDIILMGLDETVKIIPNCKNVNPYFKQMDVFILSSREDPFPLAMLEAGFFEVPILGFKKSGGIEELINPEYLVEYADTHALADKVIELFNDPEKRRKIGRYNKSICERFQVQNRENELIALLMKTLKKSKIHE